MGRYRFLYLLMITALIKGLGAENAGIRMRKAGMEKENIRKSVSEPVELVEKRTRNSKTFLNPDGSYTAIIYPVPIHYYENGEWKEIPGIFSENGNPGFNVLQSVDSLTYYKFTTVMRYIQNNFTIFANSSFNYVGRNESYNSDYQEETFRTLIDYDVSSIPSDAIIQSLELILQITNNGSIDFSIEIKSRKKRIDQYSAKLDTLWFDIDNGKSYGSRFIDMDSLNQGFTRKKITLNSDAVQDFQNRLPFGLFKIGLKSQSEDTDSAWVEVFVPSCYLKVRYTLNIQTQVFLHFPDEQNLILGTGSQYAISWDAADPDYVREVKDSLSINGGVSFIRETGTKNNELEENPWQSFHYWRVPFDIVSQEWGSLDNCKIKIVAIGTNNAYDISDNPFKIVNFPWYYSGTSDSRWEKIWGGTCNDILVHPENNGVLLLASGGGIHRSEDFGNSWTFLEETSGASFECIEYAPSNPDIIYAGVGFTQNANKRGVWKSTNGGKTFFRTPGSSQMDIHYVRSISIHPANPNIVYIAGYKEEVVGDEILYIGRVYKTTDGGNTWVLKTNGLPYYGYFRSIAVSPSNPNIV